MKSVSFSNLDKVLFPACGFTKGALVDYYREVAPTLLPHVARRPLTLVRFPDGVEAEGFYQTNIRGEPAWVEVALVAAKDGRELRYVVADELATLLWIANLGTIEVHPFLWSIDAPESPLVLVFDLDPGEPAGLLDCARVALRVRAELRRRGLESFVKTSGSKGLHVYVPLRGARFVETKGFAKALARELATDDPTRVTDRAKKAERAGKVFIDWGQNDRMKSTVAPYSLRAGPVPLVSTPLRWEELETDDERGLHFTPRRALERIAQHGDLFAPVNEVEQKLS